MTIPSNIKGKAETEFGRGLIICLIKFAEHAEKWFKQKESYHVMAQKSPDLWTESSAVEMFFNAASDHLYDIMVPAQWKGTEIETRVLELQSFGLHIGHGFDHTATYTEKDVVKAYDLCREIGMLIDRELGLEPDIGQW